MQAPPTQKVTKGPLLRRRKHETLSDRLSSLPFAVDNHSERIIKEIDMSKIFYVDALFEASYINPFDNNNAYKRNWIMFKLIDEHQDFISYTGKNKSNLFHAILTKKCEGWKYRIMDFISYEIEHNMNIIISADQDDLNEAKRIYHDHSFQDEKLRYYEPKVLIHSTPLNSWESIKESNCLKSWNVLKEERILTEEKPIGHVLGDPYDYSDYVMFGGGVACEIVVASKQKNRIDMDRDAPYKPGARLYFDAVKIANDGLLVRDGFHYKVKDKLPLTKYLIWSATSDNIDLEKCEATPFVFANLADEMFQKKFKLLL